MLEIKAEINSQIIEYRFIMTGTLSKSSLIMKHKTLQFLILKFDNGLF